MIGAANTGIAIGATRHSGAAVVCVGDAHGSDWFPIEVGTFGSTTFYLRRAELVALRDRLTDVLIATEPSTILAAKDAA